MAAFDDVITRLRLRGVDCPKTHIVGSYGLIRYPEYARNFARVGIALYGMLSTYADTDCFGGFLEPVLSIKARVAMVKELLQGEAAGYGLRYSAPQDVKIATVTIGYGDGLPRTLSCGVGHVLIHGRKAPIIGRVCMDQLLVDITVAGDVKPGDIAVILGCSGEESITACDMAQETGTIANEILSRLGPRLDRYVV